MRIHILLNALIHGDAVSTHCLLLRSLAAKSGIEAFLYASCGDQQIAGAITPLNELTTNASRNDILFHQLFNATDLMPYVEEFPGRRILMYHNITPPEWFTAGSEVRDSCEKGLELTRSLVSLYDYAVGMSEFSRASLQAMGYSRTGVFPLLVDIAASRAREADRIVLGSPRIVPNLLVVGRVAPNKCIEDTLRLQALCSRAGKRFTFTIVGDDRQHPDYVGRLRTIARDLGLREGSDFAFAGKVSSNELAAHFLRASVYISMSEHEGFCAPLIEAMAYDVPVFAYEAAAVSETLGGAGVGFKDKKNFEDVIPALFDVIEKPAAMSGIIARQRARLKDFSEEEQRGRVLELIGRVTTHAVPERSNAKRPTISVVINTYNRAPQLRRCLKSLSMQRYRDFEVVIVNGPSTDDTASVLTDHKSCTRIVQTETRKLSVSRNLGINASRGELVAFIDDDAVATPDWLSTLVRCFDDERVGGAGGLVYRMTGREIEFRNGVIDVRGVVNWDRPTPGRYFSPKDRLLNTVSGNNCIFRREALIAVGGFDERIEYYHDEADVAMRLHASNWRVVHCPGAVVYHESAASLNRRSAYHLNWFAIFKNTLYCPLKNSPNRFSLAPRIVVWLWARRAFGMLVWMTSGKISLLDLIKMEYQAVRGTFVGLVRGLWPRPRYLSEMTPAAGSILHFADGHSNLSLSVCLLTQSLPEKSPGGIATYTTALARALVRAGCEVHVLSGDASKVDEYRDGIWYHPVTPEPLTDVQRIPADFRVCRKNLAYANGARAKLNDLIARWNIDIVESPSWDAEGVLCALEHRLPVVVRVHTPLFKVMETQQWKSTPDLETCCELEGLLIHKASAVSGSTKAILSLVDERYQLTTEQTVRIPLGIEIADVKPREGISRTTRILFVGRLEERKGIHVLLRAIPIVLASRDNVVFEIVGSAGSDPTINLALQDWRTGSRKHDSRVRVHGELCSEEVDQLFDECDFFVGPSLFESFGLVFVEAMSHGKPVIGTNAGGIPELVRDGITGLLVPPGDAEALTDAILKLVDDPQLCRKMGTAALRDCAERFSDEVMAERTLAFYSDVVSGWKAANPSTWSATAIEMHRTPGVSLAWADWANRPTAFAEAGRARTIVYGPYITLEPGDYRAAFSISIESAGPPDTPLLTIDVFSNSLQFVRSKTLTMVDFPAGPGTVGEIYFRVPAERATDYEFRVATAGVVPVHVGNVRVLRLPIRTARLSANYNEVPSASSLVNEVFA